jgi:hypothetical protein
LAIAREYRFHDDDNEGSGLLSCWRHGRSGHRHELHVRRNCFSVSGSSKPRLNVHKSSLVRSRSVKGHFSRDQKSIQIKAAGVQPLLTSHVNRHTKSLF